MSGAVSNSRRACQTFALAGLARRAPRTIVNPLSLTALKAVPPLFAFSGTVSPLMPCPVPAPKQAHDRNFKPGHRARLFH